MVASLIGRLGTHALWCVEEEQKTEPGPVITQNRFILVHPA